jgi:hypothetical protein
LNEIRFWTRTQDKLLGKAPDDETAKLLGRTKLAIQRRRLKLGIPVKSRTRHRWTTKRKRSLARLRDREVAERLD